MNKLASRKFVVALVAILASSIKPEAGVSVAAIAVAFFGAHAAADWKNGNGKVTP